MNEAGGSREYLHWLDCGPGDRRLTFRCPGCGELHAVRIGGEHPCWSWNGSYDKPTFQPSVLVTGVERLTEAEYSKVLAGGLVEPRPLVCHSFVVDGQIQFLGDCTHAQAGQTVPLPRWCADDE